MSSDTAPDDLTSTTALAMNRALAAEKDAGQSIEQCRKQAETLVDDARRKAQRIQLRADRRISRIAQRVSQRMGDQLKALGSEIPYNDDHQDKLPNPLQQDLLIDTIVDDLLGLEGDEPR